MTYEMDFVPRQMEKLLFGKTFVSFNRFFAVVQRILNGTFLPKITIVFEVLSIDFIQIILTWFQKTYLERLILINNAYLLATWLKIRKSKMKRWGIQTNSQYMKLILFWPLREITFIFVHTKHCRYAPLAD